LLKPLRFGHERKRCRVEKIFAGVEADAAGSEHLKALGGLGHTFPFLIPAFRMAMVVAFGVVLVELATITRIRHRYMDTPTVSAALQVGLEAH
jgi:hypothetical protein